MKLPGSKVTALGLILLLEVIASACGARSTPAGPPSSPAAGEPSGSVPAPPETPEPPERPPVPPADDALDCALTGGSGSPVETVGLTERIDPSNAPYPTNEGERLVFRQVYETLVRVDCAGRVRPALAATWRLDADGRTWILTLREGVVFSDGTPLTSFDVRALWSVDGGDSLRPRIGRLISSVVPLDDRTLAIVLRHPSENAPAALAHTDLAVAKHAESSSWPLGTRAALSALNPGKPTEGVSVTPLAPGWSEPVRFLVAEADPRDVLDRQVDLLLTRDPAAVEYAATLPHYQVVPLTWNRIQVLLLPDLEGSPARVPDAARDRLAADAVRGDARGAVAPFWWERLASCRLPPPETRASRPLTPRIVYDADDPAARDLAERLVALARGSEAADATILDALVPNRPRRNYQRAGALTGEPLNRARRVGRDAGYLLSVERRPLDACREAQVLTESVRWLRPETIVPLVETRLHAIVRNGRSGITADWDGGLHLAEASGTR